MSKFKIGPSLKSADTTPMTPAEFAQGASLVQSQVGSRPVKPVRLNLDLDPALHRQLKIRAAESETTVAALVRDLIVRELA